MDNLNSNVQFKTFDWLRFPLIIGVVFIHCFGKPFDFDAIDFSNLSGMDCYNLFRVCISRVLTHICVPVFFLISGYLFFIGLEKWNNHIYFDKIKKRCKTLLIPFLIWNSAFILLSLVGLYKHSGLSGIQGFFIQHEYWHLYWDCNVWNLDRLNWCGATVCASGPYLVPLWFLRDLMVVCLCSPIFYFVFCKIRIVGLFLLLICYVSGIFINKPGFSAMAFLFFGAGAYFRINNIDMTRFSYHYRNYIYILAIFLCLTCSLLNGHNTLEGNVIYPFYVILGSIALLNISAFIVKKEILPISPFFVKSSFFVYLIHPIMIVSIVSSSMQKIFGESNPIFLTIGYLVVPIAVVTICISIYYLLNKFTPRLCKFLTGNR